MFAFNRGRSGRRNPLICASSFTSGHDVVTGVRLGQRLSGRQDLSIDGRTPFVGFLYVSVGVACACLFVPPCVFENIDYIVVHSAIRLWQSRGLVYFLIRPLVF